MIGSLRDFRRPRLWLRAWFAMGALTVLVSLMPMPDVPVRIDHFDKLEHLVGYAGLAAYGTMLFATPRARAAAAAAAFALGIAIEGLQMLAPWRSGGDVLDMAANALGVLAGAAVQATPLRHALQALDAQLGSRQAR